VTISEIITHSIAIGSLLLAYLAWRSSQKTAKEQLDLQKTTARLAEKQLEQIVTTQAIDHSSRAILRLSIEPHGKNSHCFVLKNVGNATAYNVSYEINPHGSGDNPIIKEDYNVKFPAPSLSPSSQIDVLAAFSFESARAFDAFIVWEDENKKLFEENTFVTL